MKFYCLLALFFAISSCGSQTQQEASTVSEIEKEVGGPCEGCEAIYEYGDKKLNAIDTLPKFAETEPKIKVSGTVYQHDGKTPADNIILYVYHTNREGFYEIKGDETAWAKRHGYIRGWLKTDKNGNYVFYTFRPAPYPRRGEPEHIHLTIKEPGFVAYYADSFIFDDDSLLTDEKRASLENRGGSGIMTGKEEGEIVRFERDIVLGLNIPDYE